MFATMKSGPKILLGFGVAVGIALAVGAVGCWGILNLRQRLHEVGKVRMPSVLGLEKMLGGQLEAAGGLRELINARTTDAQSRAEQYQRIAAGLKRAEEGRKTCEALPQTPGEAGAWEELIPVWEQWKTHLARAVELSRERDLLLHSGSKPQDPRVASLDEKLSAAFTQLRTAFDQSSVRLLDLVSSHVKGADDALTEGEAVAAQAQQLAIAFVLAGSLVILGLGVILGKGVCRTRQRLLEETSRLAAAAVAGQLQTRGNPEALSPEFRPIVEGINRTLDALINPLNVAAQYLDRIAKGDIPEKITATYQGDFNEIKKNLNQCIDALNGLIDQASVLAAAAAEGRLDVRADESRFWGKYRDIVRGMNQTLAGFAAPAAEIADVLKRMARKDFSHMVQGQYPGEYGKLRDDVNLVVRSIREALAQINATAAQFAEGSRLVADSSDSLAQGAQSQSSSVEEITASIEELSHSVNAIKESAHQASELANETNKLAAQGGVAMQKSIESMEQIRTSAQEISEIIQVISEIASQTNLLALNAAIEAARAGEHGMGFAVVADEVRKLAERSNQAAREISNLIRESSQRVEEGAQLSDQTGQALREIIKAAEATAAKVAEIAAAAVQQAASAHEVSAAIQTVAKITEEAAAGSEQMASSSQQLGAQAAMLRDLVAQFVVG